MNIDIYSFVKVAKVLKLVNPIFKDVSEDHIIGKMVNHTYDHYIDMLMRKENAETIGTAGYEIVIYDNDEGGSAHATICTCIADDIVRMLLKG